MFESNSISVKFERTRPKGNKIVTKFIYTLHYTLERHNSKPTKNYTNLKADKITLPDKVQQTRTIFFLKK